MAGEKINKATHEKVIVVNPDTDEKEIRFRKKEKLDLPTAKKTEETEKKKKKVKPRRDPNREPNTKIFDSIGEVLKTPYIIRGGNAAETGEKYAKGGRITLRGGGICKRGMNKKARGKNS